MFDPASRYAALGTAQLPNPDGTTTAYVPPRILPQPRSLQVLTVATVAAGERLDLLAARTLGDATQYWRLCDANGAMDPEALLTAPGQAVVVPLPMP